MAEKITMQQLRDTSTNLATINPTLLEGQICYVSDINKIKIGDGVRPFNNLPYQNIDINDINNLTDSSGKIKTSLLPNAQTLLNANSFVGATDSLDGVDGFVPAPEAGQEDYFLKASGVWAPISTQAVSSVNGIKLSDVSNAYVSAGNNQVSLNWKDPDDITLQGVILAKWAGTKIIRKVGSVPQNINDGVLVFDSTMRNAYASTSYVDTTVSNNTVYYYRFFPYTDVQVYTMGAYVIGVPSGIERASLHCSWNAVQTISMGNNKTRTIKLTTNSTGRVFAAAANQELMTTNIVQEETTVTDDNEHYYNYTLTINSIGIGTTSLVIAQDSTSTLSAPDSIVIPVNINAYHVWTAKIDYTSDGNPDTIVSYADDAIGMTIWDSDNNKIKSKMDAWDEVFGHYPCMLKNGFEGKRLKKDDFTTHVDNTPADITSGAEGDVMICFPRRGIKIYWEDEDRHTLVVSMTDNPNDSDFTYYAHSRYDDQKDKFYLAAFLGSSETVNIKEIDSETGEEKIISSYNKVRSLAEKTVLSVAQDAVDAYIDNIIGYRKPNMTESHYNNVGFYQWTYLQVMYILKYKKLKCRDVIGYGHASNSAQPHLTGRTKNQAMDFYGNNDIDNIKLFGLENIWGQIPVFLDGISYSFYEYYGHSGNSEMQINNNPTRLYWVTGDYNVGNREQLSGKRVLWTTFGNLKQDNWIGRVHGTCEGGFLKDVVSKWALTGNENIYFCAYHVGYMNCVGGNSTNNHNRSMFSTFNASPAGVRLMYL